MRKLLALLLISLIACQTIYMSVQQIANVLKKQYIYEEFVNKLRTQGRYEAIGFCASFHIFAGFCYYLAENIDKVK